MINIIAAIQNRDRGLGYRNDLLYQLPEDMKFFRTITKNTVVIMGRKTWESIPEKFRPLPHRENIVITRQDNYEAAGAVVVSSFDDAIKKARKLAQENCHSELISESRTQTLKQVQSDNKDREIFIIGGEQIYKEALPLAHILYLTIIEGDKEADVFFPPYQDLFKIIEEKEKAQSSTGLFFQFLKLVKV